MPSGLRLGDHVFALVFYLIGDDFVTELGWSFSWLLSQIELLVRKRCISSLECWSQINISWYDASIYQTKHSILNIIFCDWWWLCKWIIPKVLWQYPFSKKHFVRSPSANS